MLKRRKVDETFNWIKSQIGNISDSELHELKFNGVKAKIIYITTICELNILQENILEPLFNAKDQKEFEEQLLSFPESQILDDKEKILDEILHGWVAIFLDQKIYLLYAQKFLESTISESQTESIIQGPKDALQERLNTNINIIRNRYHNKNLVIETRLLSMAKLPTAIMYESQIVDQKALNQLEKQLSQLQAKSIHSAQEVHKLLMNENSNLIPTILVSDRPDRIIKNLDEGKVIMIIEGFPFALILPTIFFDFMSSMEDSYQLPFIGKFLIILRYISLFITMILPGFYVGMTTYNPELFRFQLALSIAGSRLNIPYPSFIEVLIMLVVMELLSEASSRLPKVIGPTATTVGGLILGEAAAEAGLISNIMVIIVSAVAISNFVIPVNSMNFAVRIIKYPILLLAIFFGLIGVTIGIIAVVFYLANLRSYGKPYLQLFSDKLWSSTRQPTTEDAHE